MPANRQGINYAQAVKLAQWVLKNSTKLYAQTEYGNDRYFSQKNLVIAWSALIKRLNMKLIKEQHEVICIGKKPLPVNVVEVLQ